MTIDKMTFCSAALLSWINLYISTYKSKRAPKFKSTRNNEPPKYKMKESMCYINKRMKLYDSKLNMVDS
jgi:hypothetical protein